MNIITPRKIDKETETNRDSFIDKLNCLVSKNQEYCIKKLEEKEKKESSFFYQFVSGIKEAWKEAKVDIEKDRKKRDEFFAERFSLFRQIQEEEKMQEEEKIKQKNIRKIRSVLEKRYKLRPLKYKNDELSQSKLRKTTSILKEEK